MKFNISFLRLCLKKLIWATLFLTILLFQNCSGFSPQSTGVETSSSTITLPNNLATAPSTPADNSTWVECSAEWGTCNFSGTRRVLFGASTSAQYLILSATSSQACNYNAFGSDPAPDIAKHCWYELSVWKSCANENQTCSYTGTRRVMFGASTTNQYIIQAANAAKVCSVTSFGSDPAHDIVKHCWYEKDELPTPTTIAGKTVVGPIIATSGQVIENVHVVNHNGACITISGQSNITIRNSEIGPCGDTDTTNSVYDVGVYIAGGSTNLNIWGNVIHDATDLIMGNDVRGPVTIDNNLFYNIRGTSWATSAIQFGESTTHYGSVQITCNMMDDRLVTKYPMANGHQRKNGDHINMYDTGGSAAYPMVFAYNRIRGALDGWGEISGSGMQLGDSGTTTPTNPGYMNVHDNIVYMTNGSGISICGGNAGVVVQNNLVDNRGAGPAPGNPQIFGQGTSDTGWDFAVKKCNSLAPSLSVELTGNIGNSNLWAFNNDGILGPNLLAVYNSAKNSGAVITGITVTNGVVTNNGGNNFQDTASPFGTTLGVNTIWDLPIANSCL